jgi:hypothetical protein
LNWGCEQPRATLTNDQISGFGRFYLVLEADKEPPKYALVDNRKPSNVAVQWLSVILTSTSAIFARPLYGAGYGAIVPVDRRLIESTASLKLSKS